MSTAAAGGGEFIFISAVAALLGGRAVAPVEISDAMQPGHIILPNGYGLSYPDGSGQPVVVGVAPNELTASEDRDWFAGTPWHKHVRARVEVAS